MVFARLLFQNGAGNCKKGYYPTETEHEAMGQRQGTEDHGKVLCECLFLFLFFLPSSSHI